MTAGSSYGIFLLLYKTIQQRRPRVCRLYINSSQDSKMILSILEKVKNVVSGLFTPSWPSSSLLLLPKPPICFDASKPYLALATSPKEDSIPSWLLQRSPRQSFGKPSEKGFLLLLLKSGFWSLWMITSTPKVERRSLVVIVSLIMLPSRISQSILGLRMSSPQDCWLKSRDAGLACPCPSGSIIPKKILKKETSGWVRIKLPFRPNLNRLPK